MVEDHEVLIIGAGMSGLGTAARLRESGRHSLAVLEKARRGCGRSAPTGGLPRTARAAPWPIRRRTGRGCA
ncbi:FAD-dependent oxidoreductase [Streptomyces olivaceoviridis]